MDQIATSPILGIVKSTNSVVNAGSGIMGGCGFFFGEIAPAVKLPRSPLPVSHFPLEILHLAVPILAVILYF